MAVLSFPIFAKCIREDFCVSLRDALTSNESPRVYINADEVNSSNYWQIKEERISITFENLKHFVQMSEASEKQKYLFLGWQLTGKQ